VTSRCVTKKVREIEVHPLSLPWPPERHRGPGTHGMVAAERDGRYTGELVDVLLPNLTLQKPVHDGETMRKNPDSRLHCVIRW